MAEFTESLDPAQGDIDAILATLSASTARDGFDVKFEPYSVLLRNEPGGPVTGGLYGYVIFEWLFIQYVAVPMELQGQGIGRQLMERAEAWARERGLGGMWLDTFSFQARPFYEKLGFSVFGEIEDHPRGASRFFLKKQF